jgi:aryl-alcohol dehydrogenase-like predicted oxidoreductase
MVMQYKRVGKTGLKVSRICLGTMTLGTQVGEAESIKLIKSALAAGVNFLDTADGYPHNNPGISEEVIGRAIRGERHSVVVATKVQARTGPGPNDEGLSRKHIMQAVEGSLRRLQTDYIDLYYCHFPDYDTPIEETLRAMDDLVHQGKVRYIGCSNFTAWQLCKAIGVSGVHNLVRFDCIEPPYNLLTRDIEYELLPFCASEGIGVCVYSPLASELLSGRHEFGKPPAEGRFTDPLLGKLCLDIYWSEINFKAVDQIKKIAREHGRSLPQFSLAWVLSNETITSAISGATTPEQLEENVSAIEIKLSPEELQACDEVWNMFRPPRYFYARDGRIRTR